jgi:hypothetical protein
VELREFTVNIRLASSWISCYVPQKKKAQGNRLLRRQRKIMDIISIAGYIPGF